MTIGYQYPLLSSVNYWTGPHPLSLLAIDCIWLCGDPQFIAPVQTMAFCKARVMSLFRAPTTLITIDGIGSCCFGFAYLFFNRSPMATHWNHWSDINCFIVRNIHQVLFSLDPDFWSWKWPSNTKTLCQMQLKFHIKSSLDKSTNWREVSRSVDGLSLLGMDPKALLTAIAHDSW